MGGGVKYYVKKDGTVSYYEPKLDYERPTLKCAICGSKDAPVWQDRPSGRKLAIQRWWFCRPCWQRHCRICGIKTEEVA